MNVKQFYDKGLAHASYAIDSEGEMAIVDPGRDPQPYLDHATERGAKIVAIIETHPHADFVSSHLELHQRTGGTIYASKLVGAGYPHQGFDDGDTLSLGAVALRSINTPGHSPDSISIVLSDESGKDHAVFTGDTLFIGDVGRPDLRENVGNMTAKREELARAMYKSTREKLMVLDPEVLVYPAHGAGSLCGKNLSSDTVSTIGRELKTNYALQEMSEDEFVAVLLEGQPFIPKYFGFDVDLNKVGAPLLQPALETVPRISSEATLESGVLVIDTRPAADFNAGHLPGAINLMDGGKFETWLGSIIGPSEKFYLLAKDEATLETLIEKTAKIGYEGSIQGALVAPGGLPATSEGVPLDAFKDNPDAYTIIDIRNVGEYAQRAIFAQAINIPLPELRERVGEIPTEKPIVVHCAGGYRSAAGASIVFNGLENPPAVYDLSVAISEF
ncbi:MAG: MBL fold metallo-hydrolase [Bacteroidota bacterium]